jgi:predicted O-methyltransferase YrrM
MKEDMMELESRFTDPRPDCMHPERWRSPDPDSTEIEVSRLVAAFVEALRPDLVIETGTAFGQTARLIGEVLRKAGVGHLVTFEVDPFRVGYAADQCTDLPVQVAPQPSLEGIQQLIAGGRSGEVGFAWLDSLFELRVSELAAIRPLLSKGAIVGIHDCGEPGATKYSEFSTTVAAAATRMGFNRISLPTPRGCTFLQWKG